MMEGEKEEEGAFEYQELKQQSFRRIVERASQRRRKSTQNQRRESLTPEALKDGMECIASSSRDISIAKLQMEGLLERSRRNIERIEAPTAATATANGAAAAGSRRASEASGEEGGEQEAKEQIGIFGGIKRWLLLQFETGRARRRAREDLRRARRAAGQVERVITGMDDALREEQQSLNFRASKLRRQSVDMFKQISDIPRRPSHNRGFEASGDEAEHGDDDEEDDSQDEDDDLFEEEEGDRSIKKARRVSNFGFIGEIIVEEGEEEEEEEDAKYGKRESVRVQMTQL